MKQIFHYILLFQALLFVACSSEDTILLDALQQGETASALPSDSAINSHEEGVYAEMPELIDGNALNGGASAGSITRSSLTYDHTTNNLVFSWGEVDADAYMCVFPLNEDVDEPPYDAVAPQEFIRKSGQSTSALKCRFMTSEGVKALTPKNNNGKYIQYISFRPYPDKTKEFNYTKKSISYESQTQTANAKMKLYYTNSDNYAAYDESEKAASAHLGAYDYLVSEAQTTDDEGAIDFQLKRVGAVVRFNIKNPAQEVFEELQLVTKDAPLFTLQGTIDLSSRTITSTKSSNIMALKFGNGGIDMTDTSTDYYDYYNNTYSGYIVAYMMLAPVDLSGDDTKIHAYLVSHTTAEPTVKKYYKSGALSKPNLTANMFYRWSPANASTKDDTSITFQEITVEQWEDDTAIDNGESGSGTIGW